MGGLITPSSKLYKNHDYNRMKTEYKKTRILNKRGTKFNEKSTHFIQNSLKNQTNQNWNKNWTQSGSKIQIKIKWNSYQLKLKSKSSPNSNLNCAKKKIEIDRKLTQNQRSNRITVPIKTEQKLRRKTVLNPSLFFLVFSFI